MSLEKRVKELVKAKVNNPSDIAKRLAEEFNLQLTIARQRLDEIVRVDRTLQYISVVKKGRIGSLGQPREKRISYHWEREPEKREALRMRRNRPYKP